MDKCRRVWKTCREYKVWFGLLIVTDMMFLLFLWLADISAFKELAGLICFFSVMLFAAAVLWTCRQEKKKEELLQEKEETPEEQTPELEEYEEFIELWAHEVKAPLALMTLILDNRREEIQPDIYKRLEYVRNQTQGYVEQILYYARLKAVHKDYLLEKVSVPGCVDEVLDEYGMMLKEAGFQLFKNMPEAEATVDRRSLCFILSQIISNSIKYAKRDGTQPKLTITLSNSESTSEQRKKLLLTVEDNGTGISPGDLPFIFDKGFSGEAGGLRKKSSGMGLYLAKELAKELNIGLDAQSEYKKGTQITLTL